MEMFKLFLSIVLNRKSISCSCKIEKFQKGITQRNLKERFFKFHVDLISLTLCFVCFNASYLVTF